MEIKIHLNRFSYFIEPSSQMEKVWSLNWVDAKAFAEHKHTHTPAMGSHQGKLKENSNNTKNYCIF